LPSFASPRRRLAQRVSVVLLADRLPARGGAAVEACNCEQIHCSHHKSTGKGRLVAIPTPVQQQFSMTGEPR
jgi:hypothetical protein